MMTKDSRIVVCGASGYIARNFMSYLLWLGFSNIRAVSRWMTPELSTFREVLYHQADLTDEKEVNEAVHAADYVFNFAASVGGIGHVLSGNSAQLHNVLINTHLVEACARWGVQRYFFASSSCVYPDLTRLGPEQSLLRESDAHPADPMGGYGWEKLFSEQLCLAYAEERRLKVSIARLHGVYGPGDQRPDSKDHVVTALAKKVAHGKRNGLFEIDVWGDGQQTRSLIHVRDVCEGIFRMMGEGVRGPLNLAHSQPVSVNTILDILCEAAGYHPKRNYNLTAPVGRKHKVSDNKELLKQLQWEPQISHETGLHQVFNDAWERVLAV